MTLKGGIIEMRIRDGIVTGQEYLWKQSDGWDWFGTFRWWEVFVEFTGLNGSGGAWLKEKWRWNGSSQTMREDIKTLSYEETEAIVRDIKSCPNIENEEER